jgi:uroporphyrin-III C-methyltransferase/precorrin-2 dehydrogenase/sirohydrochlorin ferrochelatase/uroporphyrin-III C-methyltransferase
MEMQTNCRVHLVGAGPGDPDLLTVKALRLICTADVVVFDRLVGQAILDLIPAGVKRIYVGKANSRHTLPQDEINKLLVRLARTGRRIVRLKGGDPYTFGRGSEEALALAEQGIACDVIPGITSASGSGAVAGIPLTHRGLATGVRYVTGHCRADQDLDLNWASLADADTTLVVYMGLANAAQISGRLIEAGLPADTPAAAVENGTTDRQRLLVTTLAKLPDELVQQDFQAPTLLIVGRVVSLAAQLVVESHIQEEAVAPWSLGQVAHA